MSLLSIIFYTISFSVPLQVIAYLPFWKHLRFSGKAALLSILTVIGLKIGLMALMADTEMEMRYIDIMFAPVHILVYLSNIRLNPFKVIFTYIFVMNYGSIINGLAAFTAVFLLGKRPVTTVNSSLCLLFFALSFPFTLRFFRNMVDRVYSIDSPIWKTVWVLPCFTTLLAFLITGDLSEENIRTAPFLLVRCGLILIMAIIYKLLLDSLETFQKQAKMEAERKQLDLIMKMQKEHYNILKENIDENRRFRHDIRHQLTVLQHYAAQNQTKKLSDYLNSILGQMPSPETTLCLDEALNAVALYYCGQAREAGIRDIELHLEALPSDCGAAENDLCILIGNLLENAVRAARSSDRPFIRLNCRLEDDLLSVSMENSYKEIRQQPDGTFLSTRKNGGGIGLLSIRSITEKYNGGCRFLAEDHVFRSLAYLHI